MSEIDLNADKILRKEFEKEKYAIWKRHNISGLREEFGWLYPNNHDNFDKFCKTKYDKVHDR